MAEMFVVRAARRPLLIPLGRARTAALILVALWCFVTVFVPIAVLVRQADWGAALARTVPAARDSIVRSAAYAVAGASVLTVIGLLLGYAVDRRAVPFWRAIDWTAIALFAIPSTVIGIGLIVLWNRPLPIRVYGTPAIIILGYIAQYTALTSRLSASALNQVPVSLARCGTGCGRQLDQAHVVDCGPSLRARPRRFVARGLRVLPPGSGH
jgi:iron(III) transport system permease protein